MTTIYRAARFDKCLVWITAALPQNARYEWMWHGDNQRAIGMAENICEYDDPCGLLGRFDRERLLNRQVWLEWCDGEGYRFAYATPVNLLLEQK